MISKYIMILILVACICACGCEGNPPVVINGQVNTTTNTIAINTNNVTIDNTSETQIVQDHSHDNDNSIFHTDYYIITGKLVSMVLCTSSFDSSTFTFSDGTVITVRNAQQFPWKINKTYKLMTYRYDEGYAITGVQQLD
jgi:hypothetical protein